MSKNIVLWCGQESNLRHRDFQSLALPTELPHQISGWVLFVFFLSYILMCCNHPQCFCYKIKKDFLNFQTLVTFFLKNVSLSGLWYKSNNNFCFHQIYFKNFSFFFSLNEKTQRFLPGFLIVSCIFLLSRFFTIGTLGDSHHRMFFLYL